MMILLDWILLDFFRGLNYVETTEIIPWLGVIAIAIGDGAIGGV